MASFFREPAREIPVIGEYDLCVIGGSCTGVFAALRAARLGLSVAIVERMGGLGGVATISMVNVWHSPYDEPFRRPILSGLTVELMERLKRRGSVTERENSPHWAWAFNSAEMQIELDELAAEHGVTTWLHTAFAAPLLEDGRLVGVAVENKSGRGAIRARFFIDASGDGDLCHRLGLPSHAPNRRQPSTTCALFSGWDTLEGTDWGRLLREHGAEFGLPEGFAWGVKVPGSDLYMLAGTRVYQDCSTAEGFSQAEREGRRQVRAIQDLLRKYAPEARLILQALPARIGIRETRHVRCLHRLTGGEILHGRRFPDAIANGSYRVDIHHADKPGITFRYLDGREEYIRPGHAPVVGRWRPDTGESPTFYQIPYRTLVPDGPHDNLLAAGRFIDADEEAHAAIRVMVNMNQTGEAAGTAAYLALKDGVAARAVNTEKLRSTLAAGGSIML
jgi:Dehydrogenases (flavoproteins)